MNGTRNSGDPAHEDGFTFSDTEADDAPDSGLGDYSARFEELMSDDDMDGDGGGDAAGSDKDEDGAFVYDGVDADPTGGYREQLRQVLGPDHEEDELEAEEVERSLVHEVEENEKFAATIEDEAGVSRTAHMLDRVCLTMLFVLCFSMSESCPRRHPLPCRRRHP